MSIAFMLFWSLLLVAAIAAYLRGGPAERAVASMYLAAGVITLVARPAMSSRYGGFETAVFVIDLLLLAGLTAVVVRAHEWWVVCATALQGLTVLGHVGRFLDPDLWRLGYQMMVEWTAWPTLLLLVLGTFRKVSTRRVAGTSVGYSETRRPTAKPPRGC